MKRNKKDILFVTVQLLLFVLYGLPLNLGGTVMLWPIIKASAIVITAVGVGIIGLSLLQLNKNLSPFPSPKQNGQLVQHGLYALIRHPIYTGILFSTIGYALYSGSAFKMVIGLLFYLLFFLKSNYEEAKLEGKFKEYEDYRKKTGRFLPKILPKKP